MHYPLGMQRDELYSMRVVVQVESARPGTVDDVTPPVESSPDWDAIDQASWESFPASDPPSWTPARATPCEAKPEEDLSHAHAPLPVTDTPTTAPATPACAPADPEAGSAEAGSTTSAATSGGSIDRS